MSVFRRVMDRLADRLWAGRKVTLRFTADYRIAGFALPLIERLLLDDDDGETYRSSIADWTLNERPPLHIYRGEVSSLRIDGPLQKADVSYLPLGGLIESPGVTAHLDPVEAQRLDARVQDAIEKTILCWIIEHGLYDQPRQRREIDRRKADRDSRAIIARWVVEHFAKPVTDALSNGSDRSGDCCSDEPDGSVCNFARKVRTMSDPIAIMARLQGRDATHRTRNLDTHLTHGWIQLFRHFSRVRLDYRECSLRQGRDFLRVMESAPRTLVGVVR